MEKLSLGLSNLLIGDRAGIGNPSLTLCFERSWLFLNHPAMVVV